MCGVAICDVIIRRLAFRKSILLDYLLESLLKFSDLDKRISLPSRLVKMFAALLDPYILISSVTTSVIVYSLGWCVYCLWYHPLAKYPGPRLAAVSQVSRPYSRHQGSVLTGSLSSLDLVYMGLDKRTLPSNPRKCAPQIR